MRVQVDEDEYYPIHYIETDEKNFTQDVTIEITTDEFDQYNKAMEEFYRVQKMIEDKYFDARMERRNRGG